MLLLKKNVLHLVCLFSYQELYNSAIHDLNDKNAIDTSSDEESEICDISK